MAYVKFLKSGYIAKMNDAVAHTHVLRGECVIVDPRPGVDMEKIMKEQSSAGIVVSFGGDE